MSLYIETRIHGSIDELWDRTQDPALHERWDLRFSSIEYLPRPDETAPQSFLYATRIGFGLEVRGEGESIANRTAADGMRTSSLRFWSDDGKSLIRDGAGYWQYVPGPDGVRFLTAYDYRVRFGAVGRAFDRCVFRPLIGWATAWSFDRLRLWIEKGIDPTVSLQRSLVHATARMAVALVWIYQGLVPKLLARDPTEMRLLAESGIPDEVIPNMLTAIGWGEILFGLLVVFARGSGSLLLTIVFMIVATVTVAMNSPATLTAAFNPLTLNLVVAALALIGLVTCRDLPSARRCLRRPPEKLS
jgi:hypothetical protein